jgi:pyruvate dehydrogenase E2 component (dihydrolipoamide acetyltransferase)
MATTEAVDVVMPQMGVSVSEGTITKWLKQVGEQVEADESLLEISTDKVDTEVPSPASGTVTQILVQEGETVDVGTKLAVIGGEEGAGSEAPAEAPEPEAPAPAAEEVPVAQPAESPAVEPEPAAQAAPPAEADQNGRSFVSPVVARIASEHNVDFSSVPGTGRGGRVTKKDILDYVESGPPAAPPAEAPPAEAPPAAAPEPAPAPAPVPAPTPAPAPAPAAEAPPKPPPPPAPEPVASTAGEQLEPMNAMRRGIAEHMRRSLDTAAHVTSAIEVDMSRVVDIRNKLKPEYQKTYGVNPTYLIFVARAVVETLKKYPWINGEIRGEQIVTRPWINLGFAVELTDGKGLIVPVVKHAEGLNLLGMAQAVTDIADRARNKKLTPDEVQGGTFTITNPGGYGTFHGTPVISQPQAGILGTYALVKRPWVVQDSFGKDVIAIRPIMNLTLTYDHRLVDGALAGRFLKDLKEALESWDEVAY